METTIAEKIGEAIELAFFLVGLSTLTRYRAV